MLTFAARRRRTRLLSFVVLVWIGLAAALGVGAALAQGTNGSDAAEPVAPGGPVRLRQPVQQPLFDDRPALAPAPSPAPVAYVPGEFERFVQGQTGAGGDVRRLGADLVTGAGDLRAAELSPLVPPDYVVAPGDEVLLTLWGTVDADLRLTVDRNGRISVPRVGAIQVSGVRSGDLREVISRRVAQVFKNFELTVSLGQLRGIRVFVTGFVVRPGTYTVTSLSTALGALLRAGGPSAAGSFRSVELRRGSQRVSSFDLYDLLTQGDRSADQMVQAGDVVHVNAVGTQIGLVGSVNKPAVLELKPGETVADALRYAGGFSAVADRSRMALEQLQQRRGLKVQQLELPADLQLTLSQGDVLRAFSNVDVALPKQRQSKRVRVEGEVLRPAEYILPEGSSVRDALNAAGGFAPSAFVYATEFSRVSVQQTQQENFDRALRDMETEFARSNATQRVGSADEAAARAARSNETARLIDRLRAIRPTGRIVLQLEPSSGDLPDLALEDGDRLYVPPLPTTVGVFGSVFNAASYLYVPERKLSDYVRLAGGPTKGADENSSFVVRANGSVVSQRQTGGWLRRSGDFDSLRALPGDTVFVPEETDKTTFVQGLKDWTQILYQFGLGIAGIVAATR